MSWSGMFRPLCLSLLLISLGCADSIEQVDPLASSRHFFDLSNFVELQDSLLRGKPMTKSVTVNGAQQTLQLESVDWAEELAPFAQSNINRPALWDAYRIDSTESRGQRIFRYAALDSSLFTRRIEVVVEDARRPLDSVVTIRVDNRFDSFIASTRQRLLWTPGHYEIYSEQAARMLDQRDLEIVGDSQLSR